METHLETEIKVRCWDTDEIRARLTEGGFSLDLVQPRHFEDNWLLDTPSGELRQRKAALRLRLAEGQAIVTFKGFPNNLAPSNLKIREELEVTVNDPKLMLLIFERLGFHPVFRYQKYRTTYRITLAEPGTELLAMFDETPLGAFLELEGTSETVQSAIQVLKLSPGEICTESYIALQHAHCAALGRTLEDMVFQENS